MKLFLAQAFDAPGKAAVRAENRPAHLEYLKGLGDAVLMAGPMLDEAGEVVIGSALVLRAADRAALDALLAADPYAKAGLFARVEAWPFRWTVNAPPGA